MKQLVVAAWAFAWATSSVSIVLTNKYLLTTHAACYTKFQYPFMLALWHMLLASGSSRVAMRFFSVPDTIQQHINGNSSNSSRSGGSSNALSCSCQCSNSSSGSMLHVQLAAVGLLFGISLVLSNWSFTYLTVPTIQMLKASTPAVIYLAGVCLHSEHLQLVRLIKVLVVCMGVAIASYGDLIPNFVGMVLQLCGVTADALRICVLQKVLQNSRVQAPALVTLAHVAPYTAASLVLPMAMVEGRILVTTYAAWRPALPAVILSGLLATSLNLVVFQLVRLTSALTTSLFGVIKECVCILVAMHVYHTVVSSMQWLGYFIAVAGLLWYQQGCRAADAPSNGAESSAGRPIAGKCNAQGMSLGIKRDAEDSDSSEALLLDVCERNDHVACSTTYVSSRELITQLGRAAAALGQLAHCNVLHA